MIREPLRDAPSGIRELIREPLRERAGNGKHAAGSTAETPPGARSIVIRETLARRESAGKIALGNPVTAHPIRARDAS